MLKLKKTEPTGHGHTTEYLVLVDGEEWGRIYRRETSRTGYRRGYCVGQVTCHAWFYRQSGGREVGRSRFGEPEFRTRKVALADLETNL